MRNVLKKKTTVGQNFSGDAQGPYPKCTAAAFTQTLGCLTSEVHGIQTHGALRGSHVQSHVEPVRDVVVHALLKTPAEFWREILFLKNHSAQRQTYRSME